MPSLVAATLANEKPVDAYLLKDILSILLKCHTCPLTVYVNVVLSKCYIKTFGMSSLQYAFVPTDSDITLVVQRSPEMLCEIPKVCISNAF